MRLKEVPRDQDHHLPHHHLQNLHRHHYQVLDHDHHQGSHALRTSWFSSWVVPFFGALSSWNHRPQKIQTPEILAARYDLQGISGQTNAGLNTLS